MDTIILCNLSCWFQKAIITKNLENCIWLKCPLLPWTCNLQRSTIPLRSSKSIALILCLYLSKFSADSRSDRTSDFVDQSDSPPTTPSSKADPFASVIASNSNLNDDDQGFQPNHFSVQNSLSCSIHSAPKLWVTKPITSRNRSDFKPNIQDLLPSTHATLAPKTIKNANHLLSNASTTISLPARLALAPFGLWPKLSPKTFANHLSLN